MKLLINYEICNWRPIFVHIFKFSPCPTTKEHPGQSLMEIELDSFREDNKNPNTDKKALVFQNLFEKVVV